MATKARVIAAVQRLTPNAPYVLLAQQSYGFSGMGPIPDLLNAIRDDVVGGYLASVAELIHADVFADFLEMADELSNKGFKDPAAVVAGSVLEEHLRKLAQRNDIEIEDAEGKPLKASRINADLARTEVYNKVQQQSVTAWLALRNSAAHGEYDAYDHKQAAALISSVRDFLIRHPAS
jgi:hypothetical protein